MADKVQFELVSPEKILLSEAVDMVVIPGTEGNFGVLPGHAPLISAIRPGTIDVYEGNHIVERIFVGGGFAEVTETRCTVLADDATDISNLDRADIEAEVAQLTGQIPALRDAADKGGDGDRARLRMAEKSLLAATAKLEVVAAPAAH